MLVIAMLNKSDVDAITRIFGIVLHLVRKNNTDFHRGRIDLGWILKSIIWPG